MARTAIYPGSFDPFTNGHLDMVKKSADIFDHVFVVIGVNSEKRRSFPASEMAEAMRRTIRDNGITNCEVCVWEGLVAEFAKLFGADYMIRGLRNTPTSNTSISAPTTSRSPPRWSRSCTAITRTSPPTFRSRS